MNSFEHSNTFLRSALARDPFCLGDLGPEDVLRIESEFPNLFAASPRKSLENKVKRPANGSPYAAPVFQPNSTSSNTAPRGVPSTSRLKIYPYEPFSRTSRSFQRPGVSNGHQTAALVPRKPPPRVGTAAFAKPYFPKPQPTRPKRPISVMKPVPSGQRDSSGQYLNKYTEELLISRRKLEEATLALKETQSQISQRLSQHSFGDSRRSNTAVPKGNVTLLEMTSIDKSPRKLPLPAPKNVQNHKPRIQSTPRFDVDPAPAQINGRKSDPAAPPETKQVKFRDLETEPSTTSDILKSQARRFLSKAKNAPGFIRPIFSNPGILKTNPNKKVNRNVTKENTVDFSISEDHGAGDRRIDNKENYGNLPSGNEITVARPRSPFMNGINEETLPELRSSSPSDSGSIEAETPLWFSPIQINNRISAEEISARIAEREQLERESTEKFEQLLFTRLLVSKYEQEGKFQKVEALQNYEQDFRAHVSSQGDGLPDSRNGRSVTLQNQPRTRTTRSKYRRESLPQPPLQGELSSEHKSILEQIAAELIRAEVLKCIHAEELNAKVDVGVGTTPSNSRDTSLKLSTISEEGLLNVTPDLTPPRTEDQKKPEPNLDLQKIHQNAKSLSLRTPELTPPRQLSARVTDNKKPNSENSIRDDLTDCSSISDFVFSDLLPNPAPKKISKQVNVLAALPDLPTPSITPPVSKHEAEPGSEKVSTQSSIASPVKTPAASVSGSAVRFTLPPLDQHRQRSPSAHSSASRSRSASKIPRRTNSGSRQESLDSKSRHSMADSASAPDTPSSVGTGLASSVSDGEFLGVPYKSPGEVSWSLSLSPGVYLGNEEDDSDSSSSDDSQLYSYDFLRAEETSEGEVRSRYGV